MFSWLYGKLQAYIAIVGAVIVAVAYAFLKGRKSGKDAVTIDLQNQTRKLDEKFQEIDNQRPDFDGAIGRLRSRG